ncbi:MAG TPA: LLM class F420-dependent oxidoreductase [Longilinea sp.]|nr:LLM class F420-dependent oxidoreductase [Longilinea sp.]
MKIGLQVPNFTWPGGHAAIAGKLAEIATAADEAGFASLWVMDHFFQIGGGRSGSTSLGPAEDEMLESYSTLSYLAGLTRHVKLGTMVTGVIYRYPGILVKTVTTLDVLSGGRAYLGIGAAWFEREALGLGVPFPTLGERFGRLEETLQIAQQMWSGKREPYHGKYYQLAETLCNPLPLSSPHPPILIGGSGEKKTLRLVAKYADACNLFAGTDVAALRHKLDVLKQHCDQVGRDYASIEKTTLGTAWLASGHMSPADIIAQCRQMADAGIQHAIFNMPNVQDITPLKIFGKEIIPAVQDL